MLQVELLMTQITYRSPQIMYTCGTSSDLDFITYGNEKAGESHRQRFKTILPKRQSIRFARNRPTRHEVITPIRPGTMNE